MKSNDQYYFRFLAGSATAILILYCGAVLFYVATSADIRIRCLLTNQQSREAGVEIRHISPLRTSARWEGLPPTFGELPATGDLLLKIGDRPVNSFAEYAFAMAELRYALYQDPTYDSRVEQSNPLDIDRYASLPAVINYFSVENNEPVNAKNILAEAETESVKDNRSQTGERNPQHGKYVRIEYQPAVGKEVQKVWVLIQTLPMWEVLLSFLWCMLEFGIFAVAALAFSHRPRDPAPRRFFSLCFITLPAFVGGYHWWVISSSPLLLIPFVFCAILVPVFTCHFFLSYPAVQPWLRKSHKKVLWGMYTPPVLMLFAMSFLLLTIQYSHYDRNLTVLQPELLGWVRFAVDIYIMIAVGYYGLSLYSLIVNYRQCVQIAERKQLQWILLSAIVAVPLVGYATYLAYADRVSLVFGHGRIPMVLVSLLFLAAYAIGILRYRLMLLDQIINRHTLYLVISQTITLAYSLLIAIASLVTVYRGMSVPEQLFPLAMILTVGILATGWLRDTAQRMVDQRFFREKYRLDRAMQQMNLVVAEVADVNTLADHMLRSCREVLQIKFSALYLREGRSTQFELVCAVGAKGLPARIQIEEEVAGLFEQVGSIQRIPHTSKGPAGQLQAIHRVLRSQLMHGFELDQKLTGVVVLGAKISNSPFTAEDITFVNAIGQMTSIALQCVRVQQNVSRMDAILQEKIRKIETQDRQLTVLKNQLLLEKPIQEQIATPVVAESFDTGNIRGSSPALQQVLKAASKVARSESTVLIRGESGTGKELLAAALHRNSPRQSGQLISVNCAALSPSLLESELFGHVKGAFTGAYRDSAGRFQLADRGTLFLDEIGDVPLEIQVKLLRVLQERRFEPVGGRESISVDVRLMAATHQNLENRIKQGLFREDLYYRLNVITLELPPLRERKEDLFELAISFLGEAADKAGKPIRDIDDLAFRTMLNYPWPGNIRELHNAIHRAVILAETDCILLENLPTEVQRAEFTDFDLCDREQSNPRQPTRELQESPAKTSQQFFATGYRDTTNEKETLLRALAKSAGNKAQAARLLGMPRSTFYSKLKKYDL